MQVFMRFCQNSVVDNSESVSRNVIKFLHSLNMQSNNNSCNFGDFR